MFKTADHQSAKPEAPGHLSLSLPPLQLFLMIVEPGFDQSSYHCVANSSATKLQRKHLLHDRKAFPD